MRGCDEGTRVGTEIVTNGTERLARLLSAERFTQSASEQILAATAPRPPFWNVFAPRLSDARRIATLESGVLDVRMAMSELGEMFEGMNPQWPGHPREIARQVDAILAGLRVSGWTNQPEARDALTDGFERLTGKLSSSRLALQHEASITRAREVSDDSYAQLRAVLDVDAGVVARAELDGERLADMSIAARIGS